MPYIINKTDGTIITTVGDGTINNSITSLTLIGKNYDKYGEPINENFVRLLENFANTSAPGNPLAGQLWWDSFNTQLKVYTGAEFKPLSKIITATAQPSNNKVGDFWWDSANNQLKIYNGTSFVVVGPDTSSEAGDTGAQAEQIFDNLSLGHFVVSLYSGTTRVAVISSDAEFIPLPALDGFGSIRPGINLAAGFDLIGTATNADMLDNLSSTDFLRANINATTSGTLGVLNDTGLAVGTDSDFRVFVSGANVTVENQTANGNLNIKVAGNASPAISVNGTTGLATVLAEPTSPLGVATKSYTDNFAVSRSGSNTITGVITPNANATLDFGSSTMRFSTVFSANVDVSNNVVIGGNLTVNGTTTTINSTTIQVDDKNIVLGDVSSPTDITADGGGITIKGSTDKSLTWVNSTGRWTFNTGVQATAFYGDGSTLSNLPGASLERYESGELTLPSYPGGKVTVTHGGSRKPDIIRVVMRRNSISAPAGTVDASYLDGDEVDLTDMVVSSNNVTTIWSNATQIGYSGFLYPPNISYKEGNYNGNVTNTYWSLVFYGIWL
jgi:hypothetical protein